VSLFLRFDGLPQNVIFLAKIYNINYIKILNLILREWRLRTRKSAGAHYVALADFDLIRDLNSRADFILYKQKQPRRNQYFVLIKFLTDAAKPIKGMMTSDGKILKIWGDIENGTKR